MKSVPRLVSAFFFRKNQMEFQQVKNNLIGRLLEGLSHKQLLQVLVLYSEQAETVIRKKTYAKIHDHITNGMHVTIVSASPQIFIEHFFKDLPVTVLGAKFEIIDNNFTGSVSGNACYGAEKVKVINQWIRSQIMPVKIIEAWSDCWSDAPMMNLADVRYWISPPCDPVFISANDPEGIIVRNHN